MSIEEMNRALKDFDESLYAREEGELFLVYKNGLPIDEFVGSVFADDVADYGVESTLREFGIY